MTTEAERVPLGARELLLILAFWTVFALLTSANRMVDPRTGVVTFSAPVVELAFFESYLWALLTPLVFVLASRSSTEQGNRIARVLLLVAVGLLVALFVDVGVELVRAHIFPPTARRRGGSPPPLWTIVRLRYLDRVIVTFAIIAAGLARDYFQRYRARQREAVLLQAHAAQLQAQLAEARLSVLRTQLNPHFLFNTLHAVSALVERDPKGVRRMIARLSELLRYTLDGTTEQEIPLHEELELLRRYLEIMQIRFQGRLETNIDAAPEVRDALVPNLILQPLVENALKHGTSATTGVGRVVVTARRTGDDLVLTVRDGGDRTTGAVGATGGTPDANAAPSADATSADATSTDATSGERITLGDGTSSGVGLRNTRARLEQLYGAHQRFLLEPAPGGGMIAEVVLPFHTRADLHTVVVPVASA
ncbi:MAG TPA: histidine kinase [Gemmatimonadaceae bacterium]